MRVERNAVKLERPDERDAAHIVRIMTGCEAARLDPSGGAQQRSDYRLLSARGDDIGLLEVTSIMDQRREAFFSPRTRDRRSWEVPGLRRLWIVWLQDEKDPWSVPGDEGGASKIQKVADGSRVSRSPPSLPWIST